MKKREPDLEWTGERLVPGIYGTVAVEHLHRYALATELAAGKDVLDIASGEGYGAALLARRARRVIGVEIMPEAVAHAKRKYGAKNVSFVNGKAQAIPVRSGSIDLVVSFETLEHLSEHDEMLAEIRRVLRPNGMLIISSPDKLNYSDKRGYVNEYHVRELYKDEFVRLIEGYFSNVLLMLQKVSTGSVIAPESEIKGLIEFQGDFEDTVSHDRITDHVYNIILASESAVSFPLFSAFTGSWAGGQIQDMEIELGKKDQDVRRLQVLLDEKEGRVADLNKEMEEKSGKLDTLEAEVGRTEGELSILRNLVEEKEKEKEATVGHLQDLLAAKDGELADQQTKLASREEELGRLGDLLAEKDGELTEQRTLLASREEDLGRLGELLDARDSELADQRTLLRSREEELGRLGELLIMKDSELNGRQDRLRQTGEEQDRLRELLHDKDIKLRGLCVRIDKIGEELTRVRSLLHEKTDEMATLDSINKKLSRDIDIITSTRLWKLAEKIRMPIVRAREVREKTSIVLHDSFMVKAVRACRSLIPSRRSVPDNKRDFPGDKTDTDGHGGFCRLPDTVEDLQKLVIRSSPEPLVSIIIPVYNKWQYTYQCLRSIRDKTGGDVPYEIIVTDDNSSDDTQKMLRKIRGIRVISKSTNMGYLRNCNLAAKEAKGKYLMFLNNDTEVGNNWLSPMVRIAQSDESVGVVGGKLLYPDGTIQEAGTIICQDGWGHPYGRHEQPHCYEYNYVKEVDCIIGACMLVRREAFFNVGMFDDTYAPAFYEEFDLQFKLRQSGYKTVYQPLSEIVHFETSSYDVDTRTKQSIINHERFCSKWSGILKKQIPGEEHFFIGRDRSYGKGTVLVIDDKVPEYDKHAGALTLYQHLRILQELGLKVAYMPDSLTPLQPYTEELQQLGIEVVYGDINFDDWIADRGSYLTYAWLARPNIACKYIDSIKKNTRAKVFYYTHDLHYLREERRYEIEGVVEAKAEAERLRETEHMLFWKADHILTPSTYEEGVIRDLLPGKSVTTIPGYFFEDSILKHSGPGFGKRDGLIFLGGFDHLPNVDAVVWFVSEIMPLIREYYPEMKLYVVGNKPPQEITALAGDRITVTGYVQDLVPWFDRARVFVAPLRYGAGVKGKIVMSMAYGLPVVTTPIGNEGLSLMDGSAALIDDQPEGFAEKTLRLYRDETVWHAVREAGRDFIRQSLSKQVAKDMISNLL